MLLSLDLGDWTIELAQSKLLHNVEGDKVPKLHIKTCWERQSGLFLHQGKANLSMELLLLTDLGALVVECRRTEKSYGDFPRGLDVGCE